MEEQDLSSSNITLPSTLENSRSISPLNHSQLYKFSTQCVTIDNPNAINDQFNSSSVPIYQSATFKGLNGLYDYSRSGNPTRTHLEHHLAKISSANHAFSVSSGMAALDVICRILKPGDHVIAGDDLYGGTNRLLTYLKNNAGVVVHHIDTCNPSNINNYLDPLKTKLVLLETPTNPLIKICDIQEVSNRVKSISPNAIIVVDNTMMSPYLQRPLELGADIVYDSATKYLSGHHDLMAGVIVCNDDDLAKHMAFTINSVGNGLGPFDSFLLLRGLKTLAIRMDRQQSSARIIASFLNKLGFKVHYPGLKNHPGYDIHNRLSKGPGAVLSFETNSIKTSERIVGGTRLWGISVSFGAVNSLISMPCLMSHASIPAHLRAERGLPEDLIRLCVGIEDVDDLLNDLENSLVQSGSIRPNLTSLNKSNTFDSEINSLERIGEERALNWEICQNLEDENEIFKTINKDFNQNMEISNDSIFVSAPGKVILFGEHAVVHGVTAIASSVDLRCYGCLKSRYDNKINLELPNISISLTWDIDTLPWDSINKDINKETIELDLNLIKSIENIIPDSLNKKARGAAISFIHHYMVIYYHNRKGLTFIVQSAIPIGAGLGSSAAFSVCLSSSMLISSNIIHFNPIKVSNDNASNENAKIINDYAFISEKILHGTPSGIDNSVSVYGGAISFSKFNSPPMLNMNGFKSMKLLLTNSKVDRDAKALISKVIELKEREPEKINKIMSSIQSISDKAIQCFDNKDLPRDALTKSLSLLIDENHRYLDQLGVSHPVLEIIKSKISRSPYNLKTKLTGAGGGGCTVTFIPDDFSDTLLQELVQSLRNDGFDPHVTSVGGSGIGYLIKETDSSHEVNTEYKLAPFSSIFEKTITSNELTDLAKNAGFWVYV